RRDEPRPIPLNARTEPKEDSAAELEALSGSLDWMADITQEPEAELTTWLAVEDTFAERDLRADDEAAPVQPDEPADALAGMTDEEIELALRRGELTAEQELAWLQRTAREHVAANASDADETGEALEDVEPAEPAELPPWLQAIREAEAGDDLA